jgi:hypothetical protein
MSGWQPCVELVVSPQDLYIDYNEELIYLGVRPSGKAERDSCFQGTVPYVHVSLASAARGEAHQLAERARTTLKKILKHVPGSELHLYFSYHKGFHEGDGLDFRCSINYGVCQKGLKVLTEVLRASIVLAALRSRTELWNNAREPHVSVLNLRCFAWNNVRIGHLREDRTDSSGNLNFDEDSFHVDEQMTLDIQPCKDNESAEAPRRSAKTQRHSGAPVLRQSR